MAAWVLERCYELVAPSGHSHYAEKILWRFGWTNGAFPVGSLIFDAVGNLYGTAVGGNFYGGECQDDCGLVFEVTP